MRDKPVVRPLHIEDRTTQKGANILPCLMVFEPRFQFYVVKTQVFHCAVTVINCNNAFNYALLYFIFLNIIFFVKQQKIKFNLFVSFCTYNELLSRIC
jgi:hypothetical protein